MHAQNHAPFRGGEEAPHRSTTNETRGLATFNSSLPTLASYEVKIPDRIKKGQPAKNKHRRTLCFLLSMVTILLFGLFGRPQTARAIPMPATTLHQFGSVPPNYDGLVPSSLLQGQDGMLYGTAEFGGLPGYGVVFKMNIDGSDFQVIHSFVGLDGAAPNSLIQAPDGTLYGTTRFGGIDFTPLTPSGLGVLFQLNTDGSNFQVRHLFTGTEGANPNHVLFGQDGLIYGTTISGGLNNTGVVFEYDPYNPFIFVRFNFDPLTSTGQNYSGNYPTSLSQTSNGVILITMASGGEYGSGTILLSDFTGFFSLFYAFSPLDIHGDNSDGAGPTSLLQGSDGYLYGTTQYGGANGKGTVFKFITIPGPTILHNFTGSDGAFPTHLIQGVNGKLFGTTVSGGTYSGGVTFALDPYGISFDILHHFALTGPDGADPEALIQGSDGCLYGECEFLRDRDSGNIYRIGPKLNFISPNMFFAGSDTSPLVAVGSGFAQNDVLLWDNIPIQPEAVSDDGTQMLVMIPAALLAVPGTNPVQIYDPNTGVVTLPPDPCFVLPRGGTPRIRLLVRRVIRGYVPASHPEKGVLVSLFVSNVGNGTAYNTKLPAVQLTDKNKAAFSPLNPLPIFVGNLPPGSSTSVTLFFPSNVVSGPAVLLIKGTFYNGSFGGTFKINVP